MISTLLTVALKSSLLFIAFVAMKQWMGNRLNANVLYRLWVVLFILVCLPMTFESKLSIENIVLADVPVRLDIQDQPIETHSMTYELKPSELTQVASDKFNLIESVYLAGFLISLLMTLFFLWRILKSCKRFDLPQIKEVSSLMGYHKTIKIYETDHLSSPAVMGLFSKKILMPSRLKEELSHDSYQYILMHEIMHLKQGDHVMNYLLLLYKAVFWFNPLTHIFFNLIKEDMEYACDERLTVNLSREQKNTYSHLLLDVASIASNRKYHVVSPFIKNRKVLKRRLNKIVKHGKNSNVLLILLVLVLTMVSLVILSKPPVVASVDDPESIVIQTETLDTNLANELISDYELAYERLANYQPIVTTVYRNDYDQLVLKEETYKLSDTSKILRLFSNSENIQLIEVVEDTEENTTSLVDVPYIVQSPQINRVDNLIVLTDQVIGQAVDQKILNANPTKFIYRTLDRVQEVYLIQDGSSALAVLCQDHKILAYKNFELKDYDLKFDILFWMNFYLEETFDYDQFKSSVIVELEKYIQEDVDLTKNIVPVMLGDNFHVFLDHDFSVRISGDNYQIFYIRYPENIHYDAKEALNESESRKIAEKFMESTPVDLASYDLIDVKFEYLYGSETKEYYVYEYASDSKGLYIKVNTLSETVSEITFY